MKNYETMVIIDAMITEEAVEREIRKIESVISENGEIIRVNRSWGKRKLAYEIRKKTHGVYVLFYYKATPTISELMEKDFRINENVLRWLTLSDQPLPSFDEEVVETKEESEED